MSRRAKRMAADLAALIELHYGRLPQSPGVPPLADLLLPVCEAANIGDRMRDEIRAASARREALVQRAQRELPRVVHGFTDLRPGTHVQVLQPAGRPPAVNGHALAHDGTTDFLPPHRHPEEP